MKNRVVNRMLYRAANHPIRSLKHAMYILVAVSIIGNGLSSCGISLSGAGDAIKSAVSDSGLQHVYESVNDTLKDLDYSSEADLIAFQEANAW